METNGSSPASPPALSPTKNHTHKHHHHPPLPHHNHATLPSIITISVVVAIVAFILLIAISLIVAMLRRFKSAKKHGNWNSETSFNHGSSRLMARTSLDFNSSPDVKGGCLYGGGSGRGTQSSRFRGVQVFTYKELEVATGQFSEANVIGNGGFGVVYRGVLSDGTVAAVKMLHRQGRQGERAFRIEVDLLCRLHCPYLVDLLGYCADQQHRLLVFEFMPNGSLEHHLHPGQGLKVPLNWGTRLKIALDCARALEFLHEQSSPSVIHRDFKCTNILLDQNFRARVSDFGLAKMGSERINGQVSTRVLGTTGYLAPEYVSTGKLTTKSDVYSYGVVLLQLLTGRVPVDTTRPPGEHVLVSWALPRLTNRDKLMEMVDPSLQGQYSKKGLVQVAAIAAMCVQQEADYRPLMTDVVQSLIPLVKNLSSISSSTSSRFKNQVASSMH